MAITTTSVAGINAVLDAKQFLKVEYSKMRSVGDRMGWYVDLVTHGSSCGYFVPPWDSVVQGNAMGNKWVKSLIGTKKHAERVEMSQGIYKLLRQEEMFPKGSEELRYIVATAKGDGYLALHNILRTFHPKLLRREIETVIPRHRCGQLFGAFVREVSEFVEREKLRSRSYSLREQTYLVYENLQSQYRIAFDVRMRAQLPHGASTVPFDLELPCLATTFNSWCLEEKLPLPDSSRKSQNPVALIGEERDRLHLLMV